ncbi:hypothetical protein IEZ26_04730 [Nocardioides cavernae]|uniref:Uncharacterized protein n=1 Tax=Nocardioides cavernae TaxID=1921566 RepID=A0ABR8N705_9ACTN|nr:hypothetical protein [Nocardioides cavernae]MBD3923918.1 hypothetical protein [Nocardioides cavernae]MBM7511146.1 hypothetical protein [Nocardioides cavernae]
MTEVDLRGQRAAEALRRATQVDPETRLVDLHRIRRHRARGRNAAIVASVALVAATTWAYRTHDQAERIGRDEAPLAVDPSLAPGETEIDSDRSPSGTTDAVAVLRTGQPAVVRVGAVGSADHHVVWSAPTPHELGDRNLLRPAAVAWAPNASELAIVVAQERGRIDDTDDLVELTLVTVGADGSGRRVDGVIGTCLCRTTRPTLSWTSADQLEVLIPDGPDRGVQRRTLR